MGVLACVVTGSLTWEDILGERNWLGYPHLDGTPRWYGWALGKLR